MIDGRRNSPPAHTGAAAVAGLSRRLARRAVSTDGTSSLPPASPVSAAQAEREADAICARIAARDQAASTAGIPLMERIGHADSHA